MLALLEALGRKFDRTWRFSKSVPSSGMAKLRDSIAELGRVVDAYVARRAAPQPARFQPQGYEPATVVKFVAGLPGGLILESDIADAVESMSQTAVRPYIVTAH